MLERNASSQPSSQPAGADWAAHEFARAPLPDPRLVSRLITVATDSALQPAASLPQACGSRAKTKAACRFFDHEKITPENILAARAVARARAA